MYTEVYLSLSLNGSTSAHDFNDLDSSTIQQSLDLTKVHPLVRDVVEARTQQTALVVLRKINLNPEARETIKDYTFSIGLTKAFKGQIREYKNLSALQKAISLVECAIAKPEVIVNLNKKPEPKPSKFEKLCGFQQFITLFLTTIVTVCTLGFSTKNVFDNLVGRFSKLNMDKNNGIPEKVNKVANPAIAPK